MNFEKIEAQPFGSILDARSMCNCVCKGAEKPLSVGVENTAEGSKQIGSCIT